MVQPAQEHLRDSRFRNGYWPFAGLRICCGRVLEILEDWRYAAYHPPSRIANDGRLHQHNRKLSSPRNLNQAPGGRSPQRQTGKSK